MLVYTENSLWWKENPIIPPNLITNKLISNFKQKAKHFNAFFASQCTTAWKVSKYPVFSVPHFHVCGLNTEIYGVNLCIQSEYRKIRTRKISVFGHFSHSEITLIFVHSRHIRQQDDIKWCRSCTCEQNWYILLVPSRSAFRTLSNICDGVVFHK